MLRAALLRATIARARRRMNELLAEAVSKASTASLRRELLQKATELETQAEEAERELSELKSPDKSTRL